MDFTGYKERVAFHLDGMGIESRPTDAAFMEAWNSQIPAKKMAQRHARLSRRPAPTSTQLPRKAEDGY